MLTSLAFIFLVGLFMAAICQRLKLPRIIGMLITGIVVKVKSFAPRQIQRRSFAALAITLSRKIF